jgi:ribosomal protein S18 acetylase RimI-like enzyme
MDKRQLKLLDNPVWNALQTEHLPYTVGTRSVQRYPHQMLPFVACAHPASADLNQLEPWTAKGELLYLVGEPAKLPANWSNTVKLDCLQMICPLLKSPVADETIEILLLAPKDIPELIELIHYVQPGYFLKDTPLLGRYFGIRQGQKLVAVAGERLRIAGFTEISAVCTHPSFTGRGFAKMLVAHLVRLNLLEGTLPFLHVLSTNTRAIQVYQQLGFKERRTIPFWQLRLDGF